MSTTMNKTNEMSMTSEQILYIKRMQMLQFQKALINQINNNNKISNSTVNNVQVTNNSATNTNDIKYKTELCKTFSQKGSCAYGSKCRFAHGKNELCTKDVGTKKYKIKECASFFTNGSCCYGNRCHFKHEERKLNELERSYFTYLNSTVALNANEETSVEDLTAIISGKGRHSKLSILMEEKLSFMRKVSVDSQMSDCNTSTSSDGNVNRHHNCSRFAFAQ